MAALQNSNLGDVLLVAAPHLRSPSPEVSPSLKLNPSLKQPAGQQHTPTQTQLQPGRSENKKQSNHSQKQTTVKGSSKRFTHSLIVEDDSKKTVKDIGQHSAFGLQDVVLRPPFSLF